MKVVTTARMREIERITIETRGVSALELMEAAGGAIARAFVEDLEGSGRAVVLCGHGNNGGDGFVAARKIAEAGWKVEVLLVADKELEGPPAIMRARLPDGVPVNKLEDVGNLVEHLRGFDAAVDAMLGTGVRGEPLPPIDLAIDALNAAAIYVLAADVPSGLNADTGAAKTCVVAARTISIGLPKLGFLRGKGPEVTGAVSVEAINFPPDLLNTSEIRTETLTVREAAAMLPVRGFDANKGTFGLCAIAAGSNAMPGAAVLTTLGALRSGCGLVRTYSTSRVGFAISHHAPEALLKLCADPESESLQPLHDNSWVEFMQKATAFAIGPGIGRAAQTRDLISQILDRASVPCVFDADALNMMADEVAMHEYLDEQHVITPHPGELARLMKHSVQEIQADRWRAAMDAADMYGCVVVLKGHGTLVASPGGPCVHIPTGNTALAKGGSGDLLTGLIGGLLAQSLAPAAAAALGCWVHGHAADIAARDRSPRGLIVRDVADAIPLAFRELEEHLAG